MKNTIKKILIIISIIIICLGIISASSISKELENEISNEKLYVDGSDFTGLVKLGGIIGAEVLRIVIIIYSILLDAVIWGIYGIVLIIIKIVSKIKSKTVS